MNEYQAVWNTENFKNEATDDDLDDIVKKLKDSKSKFDSEQLQVVNEILEKIGDMLEDAYREGYLDGEQNFRE